MPNLPFVEMSLCKMLKLDHVNFSSLYIYYNIESFIKKLPIFSTWQNLIKILLKFMAINNGGPRLIFLKILKISQKNLIDKWQLLIGLFTSCKKWLLVTNVIC